MTAPKLATRLALIAGLAVAGFSLSGAASAETLTVTVTGIKAGAPILGALQTEDQFLKPAVGGERTLERLLEGGDFVD